ncbi:MAG: DegT/DnrJ/EryC1/StrS family aminotransferase [Elusimicrobia bacterium]|nr:DegT/DnrJ/EryC1/StrS family aminotransferase [Elusimicrobiota bacterium]
MGKLAINGGKKVRTQEYPTWPVFGATERKNLLKVFDSGKWWYGENVKEFEAKYAKFQDAKYAVACCNGTIGLEMALLACGVGAGDEVIVPPYTFMATASAVLRVNAIPVFADIELDTANINPKEVERKITSKTKAIIPVHFGGMPCDMDTLKNIAKKHNIRIIEDACHSWGTKYKGKGTGALGDCGVFSFQMGKNITSGEGGIFISDNNEIAETARSYHNCGRGEGKGFYEHYLLGSNFRMTELQAAILLGQLTRLEKQTLIREKNGYFLDKNLKNIPGISLIRRNPDTTRQAFHMYLFRFVRDKWEGITRNKFLDALMAEGVLCHSGYPIPLYKNPIFMRTGEGKKNCPISCPYYGEKVDYTKVVCPNSETICEEAVYIPQRILLSNKKGMQDIVDAVTKIWENRSELK